VTEFAMSVQGVASNCAGTCVATGNFCGFGAVPTTASPITWSANAAREINISCILATGDKPKVHIMLNYTQPGGSYKHTVEGDIQVKLSP
jgi:hypothetical protein